MACTKQSFEVLPIGPDDFDRTIDFLSRFFYVDSPINAHLQLDSFCDISRSHREYLSHMSSFQAVDAASGRIIGVFVNRPIFARDQGVSVHHRYTDAYAMIVRFIEFLEAQSPLFATSGYPDCNRALEAGILSVDTTCRGLGVGSALIERTVEWARSNRYPLVTCLCTSVFSARLCEKAGFVERFRYTMADWVDADGSRPLQVGAPHTDAVLYTKRF